MATPLPGSSGMFEQPDQIIPGTNGSKLYCFLNESRVCNASCMAYNASPVLGPDYVNQPFVQCHLLLNAHRTGKHLVIVADAARKHVPTPSSTMPEPPRAF